MKPRTLEVWDAICQRALKLGVQECEPEMVSATSVAEAIFPILKELGAKEGTSRPLLDMTTEQVIVSAFAAGIEANSFGVFKVMKREVRDTARDFAQMAFTSIMLDSRADLTYGPLPAGLRGRDQAMAALALEILEMRSPQRLLAQQHPPMH